MENADPPSTVDARVDDYLGRIRELPADSVAGAFAPPDSQERSDPYDAFARSFLADAPLDGPLAGLDLAVKESIGVGGVPTTCGTDVFEWEPETDAVAVERLRASGAALVGTTKMDAFGLGTTGEWAADGPTENPAVEGYVPGGSSSGSAAAVASGAVDAALGTDTAGSVRIPAAFCGVVGYKPTYGLVPTEGVVDLSPSNDHVGIIARDVETTALTLEAIAGRAPTRPESLTAPTGLSFVDDLERPPPRLRLGLLSPFMEAAAPDVEARIENALSACIADLDAEIGTMRFPEADAAVEVNAAQTLMEFADLLDRGQPLGTGRPADMRAALRRASNRTDEFQDRVADSVEIGRGLLAGAPDAYGRTWDARRRVIRRQQALFSKADILVAPTTPIPAPAFGAVPGTGGPSVLDTVENTAPFNATGAPAVTVPCGEANGRPVGLQLVGPPGSDGFLLRVAESLERALERY